MATPGCQKTSPSYKFNSLNFYSEKIYVITLWEHLKSISVQRLAFPNLTSNVRQIQNAEIDKGWDSYVCWELTQT